MVILSIRELGVKHRHLVERDQGRHLPTITSLIWSSLAEAPCRLTGPPRNDGEIPSRHAQHNNLDSPETAVKCELMKASSVLAYARRRSLPLGAASSDSKFRVEKNSRNKFRELPASPSSSQPFLNLTSHLPPSKTPPPERPLFRYHTTRCSLESSCSPRIHRPERTSCTRLHCFLARVWPTGSQLKPRARAPTASTET